MAYHENECIGCIVSKLDINKKLNEPDKLRGYIAMLAVNPDVRRFGLGK